MSTAALPLSSHGRRRALRRLGWGLGGVPLLLLTFVVALTASTASLCSPTDSGPATVSAPSKAALSDIPGNYLRIYVAAGKTYGLDWSILAGIGSIETNHGRLDAPGVTSGANAFGCCGGPMQFFFKPYSGRLRATEKNSSTWGAMSVDGNGDGFKTVWDPEDAIPSAARYLKASGAPGNWRQAVFAYNRAQWYVDDVLGRAKRYRNAAIDAGGVTSIPVTDPAMGTASAGFSCASPAAADGAAEDVTAAVTPWINKDWGEALAAGMRSLGWGAGTPWCQIFVQNVLEKLGIDRPTPTSAHSSDPYTWASTKHWGTILHGPSKPASASLLLQPGDIVMYGAPFGASQHVNMVETVDQRGVTVVGGNQSCPGGGTCVSRRGPTRLTGTGGSLRWSTGDTRPIWAIVRPPTPNGAPT